MTNEEYYEYHESKHSLMMGQLDVNDYFHCEVCDKDCLNENMSEEKNVCKDCYKDTVSVECPCGRKYWATAAYAKKIDEGKIENKCGFCDGSHQPEGDDR